MMHHSSLAFFLALICLATGQDERFMVGGVDFRLGPWGHLITDGAVRKVELFRASFGGLLPCAPSELSMVEPADACDEKLTLKKGTFAVVDRGTCTFVQKALNVQNAGASGMILINQDDGLLRMPMGDQEVGNDIYIPCVMVRNSEGPMLREIAKLDQPLRTFLLPHEIDCEGPPSDPPPRVIEVGMLEISENSEMDGKFEFSAADFGGPLPVSPTRMTFFDDSYGCEYHPSMESAAGTAWVLPRGECSFVAKATLADKYGARVLMVVNSGQELMRMQAAGSETPALGIATTLITPHAYSEMLRIHQSHPEGIHVSFINTLERHDNWARLAMLRDSVNWRGVTDIEGVLTEIKKRVTGSEQPNASSEDRDMFYESIREAAREDEL